METDSSEVPNPSLGSQNSADEFCCSSSSVNTPQISSMSNPSNDDASNPDAKGKITHMESVKDNDVSSETHPKKKIKREKIIDGSGMYVLYFLCQCLFFIHFILHNSVILTT